jgi:hypothetical protein
MSVNFCQTSWCHIPEDSTLHSHHWENLKPHDDYLVVTIAGTAEPVGFDSLKGQSISLFTIMSRPGIVTWAKELELTTNLLYPEGWWRHIEMYSGQKSVGLVCYDTSE